MCLYPRFIDRAGAVSPSIVDFWQLLHHLPLRITLHSIIIFFSFVFFPLNDSFRSGDPTGGPDTWKKCSIGIAGSWKNADGAPSNLLGPR